MRITSFRFIAFLSSIQVLISHLFTVYRYYIGNCRVSVALTSGTIFLLSYQNLVAYITFSCGMIEKMSESGDRLG